MKKILVVEDDNILSKAIVVSLTEAGFRVVVAKDGETALKKVKVSKPDLVLLDLIMPKMSGEEFLETMRKLPPLRNIPVIISTVKYDDASITRCTALGIQGYLIKAHYSLSEIIEKIRSVLDGAAQKTEKRSIKSATSKNKKRR